MKSYIQLVVMVLLVGWLGGAAIQPLVAESGNQKSKDILSGARSNEPINITSNQLTLKSDQRVFTYTGNVKVVQADMTLTADELQGTYDENNQIKDLVARKNVTIVKGENIRATSQRAVYTAATEVITLTENPKLEQDGSTLLADVIKVLLREDRSIAEGNVQVTLVKKSEGTPMPLAPAPTAAAAPDNNSSGVRVLGAR